MTSRLTSDSDEVCQLLDVEGADLAGVLSAVPALCQADHQLAAVLRLLHFAPEHNLLIIAFSNVLTLLQCNSFVEEYIQHRPAVMPGRGGC